MRPVMTAKDTTHSNAMRMLLKPPMSLSKKTYLGVLASSEDTPRAFSIATLPMVSGGGVQSSSQYERQSWTAAARSRSGFASGSSARQVGGGTFLLAIMAFISSSSLRIFSRASGS